MSGDLLAIRWGIIGYEMGIYWLLDGGIIGYEMGTYWL